MTVERREIRCAVKEALLGATRAGQNVTAQRFRPILPEKDLAGAEVFASLQVYTLSEDIETGTDSPRDYDRALDLAVEVYVEQGPAATDEDAEDLIDELCDQVECVVDPLIPQLLRRLVPGTDETLAVNTSKSGLVRVDIGFDAKGLQLGGAARLLWRLEYVTDVDERDQARATDLYGARVTYRFPPLPAEDAAVDAIDLAQG